MEQEPDSLTQKKAILEYWTLVEFFSPYILENALDGKQHYQKIYADEVTTELATSVASKPLPWLNAPIIHEDDPTTPFAKGYNLYLGLFNVEETADRARHVFAKQPSQWQSVNWKSCAQSSTTTAFARLTVTTHGIPLIGTLSLSTLPWAHGRLLEKNKDFINIEQYWKSVNRLLLHLREEFLQELPKKLMKEPKTEGRYLDLDSIFKLTEILFTWAGYKPTDYPLALIEPLSTDSTQAAKEPKFTSEKDVPILNSFYIQDLEAATSSLATQQGMPIDQYISSNENERILLESEEGLAAILHTVRPENTPSGRWPDSLMHNQDLMQQFAVNACVNSLKDKGVFSVNGPPGTGKTSLLREIIAENIVARASRLSQLKTAQSAFIKKHAVSFENSDPIFVSEVCPSLQGYEMLIVSSNNTAVQNLSKELPLRAKLDPSFYNISYLESVATKALGVKEKEAWGLIAATLGNTENCQNFVEGVFTAASTSKGASRIWEWIDEYNGPSFEEAKIAFLAVKNRQQNLSEELELLSYLHDELHNHTAETYAASQIASLVAIQEESERTNEHISKLLLEEIINTELLDLLKEQETLWKKEGPNPFSRMLDRKAAQEWKEKLKPIRANRLAALQTLHECKTEIKTLSSTLQKLSAKESEIIEQLLDQLLQFYTYQKSYEQLTCAHPAARMPDSHKKPHEQDAHTSPFYQTKESNTIRSELFASAILLHEAWLAETLRVKGGFRGNLQAIYHILQGKSPTTADDTKLVWQSLFLVVPVISSTFASVGRLFRHVEPGTFGWVLIDEAGQAVPQAAVGAIWRAKRVLSIGDPFQIEPICTIPPEVIDGMAKTKIKDYTLSWAPSQVSVQNLMDRASTFGSTRTIRNESYWLGSPLRVHRRCQEPMFSISNAIAYENSMLLATNPCNHPQLPPSCWWDVSGPTTDRQYVPKHAEALLDLLMQAFMTMQYPDLYIISPFKEVIAQLQRQLLASQELKELFKLKFPDISLHSWIRQSVGTVHTFQGKQAAVVFFVLGADKSTLPAIEWASRKPNLLNVAVTRAGSRFYIIGDYTLWKNWPHFEVAAKKLKAVRYSKASR